MRAVRRARERRRLKYENFDDADADAAVLVFDHSGVRSTWQRRLVDGRFRGIARLQMSRLDRGRIRRGLPVVVRRHRVAVLVVQFQRGIRQRICDSYGLERGTDAANYHVGRSNPALVNEATDHDVVASLDESTRRDVSESGRLNWIEIKSFDHRNSRGVIRAAHHGGVVAGIEGRDNPGFITVAWGHAGTLNINGLVRCQKRTG